MPIKLFTTKRVYVCENAVVVELVKRSLPPGTQSYELAVDTVFIDFGGCMMVGTKPIDVPETLVGFFPQHYPLLRVAVGDSKLIDRHHRIYAQHICCLTLETFAKVERYLRENEKLLLEQEAASAEALRESIAKIGRHPNIKL